MNALRLLALAMSIAVASCGGRVQDDGVSGAPSGAEPTSPSSPGSRGPSATPSAPAAPLPRGETQGCGLLEGDVETNLAAYGRARAIGVYEVAQVVEECSGAGGLHVTFKRRGGCTKTEVVHFGEHGCYTDAAWAVGDRAVVGVEPESGSVRNPGWCLDDVAPWKGVARATRRLVPGENESKALAAYGCTP